MTSLGSQLGPGAEPARRLGRRTAARSCCRSRCSPTTTSPRSSTSTTTATTPASPPSPCAARSARPTAGRACESGSTQICAAGVGGHRGRRPADRAVPARRRRRTSRRSRRCCSPAPCTSTWSGSAPAPASGWSSRRATPARCTTSRCSSATAPPRSTPTWRWPPSRTSPMRGDIAGVDAETGRQEPGQGAGQGRAQDDVEDRRLHGGLLHRRADLRGGRPRPRGDRHLLHRHHVAARRRRLRRARRGGARPATAAPSRPTAIRAAHRALEVGGEYQWRREGELHLFNPTTVFKLQHSTRQGRYEIFKEYTRAGRRAGAPADDAARALPVQGRRLRPPVDIDEVEPVEEIVKRFATGAISYGSISKEMHETLAIAMNRLGGKSNTGEGGEDADRYTPDANGDYRRSAIKQVASGRFGVTSEYLVNADDLQIKISQGAKPGEGGQLPGSKVYPWIAKTRYSTPGVGLISPPPHHDIYSIEDIKQLIHDLKNANPARARARQAGEPGRRRHGRRGRGEGVLRRRAHLRARRRHRRVPAVARSSTRAARGSWGWPRPSRRCCATACATGSWCRPTASSRPAATSSSPRCWAPRSSASPPPRWWCSGCIMMRVCHLDTCPVGVATQNPELRKRFDGRPEYVVNFMRFIAQEVREYLARAGLPHARRGRRARRDARRRRRGAGTGRPRAWTSRRSSRCRSCPPGTARHRTKAQDHGLEKALDNTLIQLCEGALRSGDKVRLDLPVRNVNRTVGTMLGYELTKAWGGEGLPDDTIDVTLTGSAGQSFGAFVPQGHHPAAGRRRQRLLRQGPLRRAAHAAARPDGAVQGRGEHHRGQRDPLRGHVRRDLRARHRRRAVLRAQLRRAGRRRGRRRPRLRVHDRRQGRRARPDRAQLRGGHVRRRRLRARPAAGPGQPGDGRHRPARRRRPRVPARRRRAPLRRDRVGGGARSCSPSGTTRWTGSGRSCRRTSSGCSRPARRRSATAAT